MRNSQDSSPNLRKSMQSQANSKAKLSIHESCQEEDGMPLMRASIAENNHSTDFFQLLHMHPGKYTSACFSRL